ncbi:MAG: hypothetical protein Q7N87_01320 [Candidatus Uhrbacteria bacterium]|nr:hypothetical protein [Candidatus Uhrbacteria bacterium]
MHIIPLSRRKNWHVIHKLLNPHARLGIALTTDEAILKLWQAGWPDCFRSEPAEHPGPFPLSLIRKLCDEHCQRDGHDMRDFNDSDGVNRLGIPYVLCVHSDSEYFGTGGSIAMPPQVNADFESLLAVTGKNYYFPRALHDVVSDETRYYLGWINPAGARDTKERDLYLWPAACIDANA